MSLQIITREDWQARPANRRYVPIPYHERPGLEGHHSVGDYGAGDDPHAFARAVQADHLGRGWTDVFYGACIWYDGRVVELRPWRYRSGPVRSFVVVFPGNTSKAPLTGEQRESWRLLRGLLLSRGVGPVISRHDQRADVECPGIDAIRFLASPEARNEGAEVMTPRQEAELKAHVDEAAHRASVATAERITRWIKANGLPLRTKEHIAELVADKLREREQT